MFSESQRRAIKLITLSCILGAVGLWTIKKTNPVGFTNGEPSTVNVYGIETCSEGACDIKEMMFLSKIEAIVFIQAYVDSLNADIVVGKYQIVQGEPHTFVSFDNEIRLKEYKLYK